MSHQIMNVFLTCLGWTPLVISLAVTAQRAMMTGAAGKSLLWKYLARPRGIAFKDLTHTFNALDFDS